MRRRRGKRRQRENRDPPPPMQGLKGQSRLRLPETEETRALKPWVGGRELLFVKISGA